MERQARDQERQEVAAKSIVSTHFTHGEKPQGPAHTLFAGWLSRKENQTPETQRSFLCGRHSRPTTGQGEGSRGVGVRRDPADAARSCSIGVGRDAKDVAGSSAVGSQHRRCPRKVLCQKQCMGICIKFCKDVMKDEGR